MAFAGPASRATRLQRIESGRPSASRRARSIASPRPALQPMALVCLEVVVPVAQPDQVVQAGHPTVAERLHVVDLEPLAEVAARDHAHRIPLVRGLS